MLAAEGGLLALLGALAGLAAGAAISLVLVYVVNRQSFNWSMELHPPYWLLGVLILILVGLAVFTAILSGKEAMESGRFERCARTGEKKGFPQAARAGGVSHRRSAPSPAVPARSRRASRLPHRVVVRHRLARRADRLPDHLLPRASARAVRQPEPLQTRARY